MAGIKLAKKTEIKDQPFLHPLLNDTIKLTDKRRAISPFFSVIH